MNKRKIVFFETKKWESDILQPLYCDHNIIFTEDALNEKTALEHSDADIICIFIHSNLTHNVLNNFKDLKFIATRSTGFDHIDLDYCQKNSIQASNVPIYGDNTVAEHAFALLLAISHNIPESCARTRKGDFSLEGLQGFDLKNKTLGIIGTGNIGKCSAQIATGFGMNILAYDLYPDQDFAAKKSNFSYVSLGDLLKNSDIISLHIPGNKQTNNLLSKKEFTQMKDGVILINTARGGIINVQALLQALIDKKVAAAGLDVLPEDNDAETLLDNNILLKMKNVIITPHNAFNTKEALERITNITIDNILSFCQGKPINLIF
ncbi:MAG: D-lactate dehydrogenase [Rickettsiales bacterium]|jgi:D-lactate dehydrogenase